MNGPPESSEKGRDTWGRDMWTGTGQRDTRDKGHFSEKVEGTGDTNFVRDMSLRNSGSTDENEKVGLDVSIV